MNNRTAASVIGGAIALASFGGIRVVAQEASRSTAPPLPIIRVGTDLIQIDASVNDLKGNPITDLKPEDFVLEVDGKKQPITNAAFFGMSATAGPANDGVSQTRQETANVPRSLIFLVDDLNMSFTSARAAQRALEQFAKEWDTKEALVALRSTSDESETVTLSRKPERFDESISKVRYNIRSNKGASSEATYTRGSTSMAGLDPAYTPTAGGDLGASLARSADARIDNGGADFTNPAIVRANFEQRVYSLLSTVNSLRSVPGRKAVVFVSEGFDLVGDDRRIGLLGVNSPFDSLFGDDSVGAALRMITEVANRASVVVYTLDPSGLLSSAVGADVNFIPSAESRNSASLARFSAQSTLRQLADDTGGLSYYNRNDLKRGLSDVTNDQRAFYLVGFEPSVDAFVAQSGKRKFHKIKLTSIRKDLRIRTRAGFYGITDKEMIAKAPLIASPLS